MIKSIALLTRKDGMTHEQFVRHWVDIHAPLAHAVPGLRRYVQSHILAERRRPDIPALRRRDRRHRRALVRRPPRAWPGRWPRRSPRPCTPTVRASSAGSRASRWRSGSSSPSARDAALAACSGSSPPSYGAGAFGMLGDLAAVAEPRRGLRAVTACRWPSSSRRSTCGGLFFSMPGGPPGRPARRAHELPGRPRARRRRPDGGRVGAGLSHASSLALFVAGIGWSVVNPALGPRHHRPLPRRASAASPWASSRWGSRVGGVAAALVLPADGGARWAGAPPSSPAGRVVALPGRAHLARARPLGTGARRRSATGPRRRRRRAPGSGWDGRRSSCSSPPGSSSGWCRRRC